MSLRTTTIRRSVTTSPTQPIRLLVFGLALVLCLAPLSGAGDPDDDWGLPAMPASGSADSGGGGAEGGSSQQAHAASADPSGATLVAPIATHLESALSLELGQLVVSAPQQASQGESAAVEALSVDAPITAPTLVGSSAAVAVQGAALVEFSPSFGLDLHAPTFASFSLGFLLLDDGQVGDFDAMLHTAAGRAHVTSAQPLGAMSGLDVARMQKLVTNQAAALDGQRVSVVILSADAQGSVTVSAVRMTPGASELELLTN